MGLRYGGKIVDDYSAMQGPCPSGFHVPTRTEFGTLLNVWTALGGLDTEGDNFIMALKLPKSGRRLSSSDTGSQNGTGYYWGTTRPTGSNAHVITCRSNRVTVTNNVCAGGLSIRPFKDSPVVPTSSWTKLYGTSIEAGGIFWSSTDGLISLSSDGTNRITIADKNLGATQVWNSGDTLSEANCGKYYQRGNNYGFPRTGTISNTSSTQVDTTGYGPGNYYSSSTFIIGNDDWASPRNTNLWGGVTGVQQRPAPIVKRYYGGKMVDDYSAMRGPCPEGFHIPMKSEWDKIKSDLNSFGWTAGTQQSTASTSYLKMPLAGYRNYSSSNLFTQGTEGRYWSCERYNSTDGRAVRVKSNAFSVSYYDISNGYSIRPFRDTPVIPDISWTVEHQGTGTAGIYSNAMLGLISISSDGTNWTTMADKNLGATTVYNIGDTLSGTNCGKYYQRGNNYGFAWTGTVPNTNTQVDAASYGPGNYFSSDVFIKSSWETSGNRNLRGGVTGVQQRPAEVIKVYKGNTLIREKS